MTIDLTHPTNLPAGDRRPALVTLPAPAPALFVTANGKEWRLAGVDSSGGRLFVPAHLDPAKVFRLVWMTEADLVDAHGPLVPLAVSA